MRFAYANEDEFVKTYCYYCEQDAVFAPTEKVIPANSECAFSLELTDGSPMLRGLGVVLDCWTTDDNRFGRRGVYIGFSQLTTTSEAIHARMLALRKSEEEESTEVTQIPVAPRTRNAPATQQQWGAAPGPKSAQHIAMPELEETDAGEMRKSITQEMRAASESGLLAAAIPQAIEEKKHNATARYEGPIRGPAIPAKRAASPIPLATLAAARSPTPPPTPVVKPPVIPPAPAAAAATSATAEQHERPSAPALPPIPIPASRPALGSNPLPPVHMARGSSPAPIHEVAAAAPSLVTPASSAGIVAATALVPTESEIATEPMVVAGSWQDRVQQIRERAHEASKKAWRRAQTTASQGWATVRSEATHWRADPRTAAQRWKPTRRAIVVFAGGILFGLILSLFFRSSPPSAPKPAASSPNRMAALFQRPPVTEQCKDAATPDTEVTALEAPPAASIAAPTKKSLGTSKAGAMTKKQPPKQPAIATTKPATATKPATVAKTTQPSTAPKPATVAKTTQPATIATKPTTIAKSQPSTAAKPTQPATTAAKPTTVAKTTQPATTATKPTTIARTAPPATTVKTTQPTTAAKTTQPATTAATATKPTTVAKTTQPATTATKPTTAKPPVQAKTAAATKAAAAKKTANDCGLDCI